MKQAFTIYRVIRIDGMYDTNKIDDASQAVQEAVTKVVADANAHNHTIENGIKITGITDCGEMD